MNRPEPLDAYRPAVPARNDEIRAGYDIQIGKSISLKGNARITPAGIIAVGATTLLVALAFVTLSRRRDY